MKNQRLQPKNIDEYIASFSPEVQAILEKIRLTIKKAAPKAEEKISYQIPTFDSDGQSRPFRRFQEPHRILPPGEGR